MPYSGPTSPTSPLSPSVSRGEGSRRPSWSDGGSMGTTTKMMSGLGLGLRSGSSVVESKFLGSSVTGRDDMSVGTLRPDVGGKAREKGGAREGIEEEDDGGTLLALPRRTGRSNDGASGSRTPESEGTTPTLASGSRSGFGTFETDSTVYHDSSATASTSVSTGRNQSLSPPSLASSSRHSQSNSSPHPTRRTSRTTSPSPNTLGSLATTLASGSGSGLPSSEAGYPFPSTGGAALGGLPRRSNSHTGPGGHAARPAGIVAMGRKTGSQNNVTTGLPSGSISGSALSSGTASPDGTMTGGRSRNGSLTGGLQLHSGLARSGRSPESVATAEMGRNTRTPIDQVKDSLERYAQQQKELEQKRSRRSSGGRRLSADGHRKEDVRHLEHAGTGVRAVELPHAPDTKEQSNTLTANGQGESMIAFPTDPAKAAAAAAGLSGDVASSATSTPRLTPLPMPDARVTSPQIRAPVINPRHHPRTGPSLGLRRQPSSSLQLDIPTTPPIQEPWSPTSPGAYYAYGRPTSSMIRKKSGELVKPSLKQRSLSTPHLPLRDPFNSTKSEPPTPSVDGSDYGSDRHKNVRFAGSTGKADERLENVVLFLREQKVTAVSKAADGEDGGYPVTDTETEADTDGADFVSFRTRRNIAQMAADEPERMLISEDSSVVPRVDTSFSSGRRDALNGEMVVLEKLELPSDQSPLALKGSVLVRNISFQKWVVIRFTMDNWQTTSEVGGIHVDHVPYSTTGDEGWDRFSFQIKLEDFKRNLHEREILMCIRFSVEGREWWDSNNMYNYRIVFKKSKPPLKGRRAFEAMVDAPTPHRGLPMSTPPIPGMRASNFGRATGWNFPNMGLSSPNHTSLGVLGVPNRPSPASSPLASTIVLAPASDAIISPPIPKKDLVQPDARDRLKLQKYSAPAFTPTARPDSVLSADSREVSPSPARGRQPALSMVIGGQYATPLDLSVPQTSKNHERRRSWGGEATTDEWHAKQVALRQGRVTEAVPLPGSPSGSALPLQLSGVVAPSSLNVVPVNRAKHDLASSDLLTPPASAVSSPPAHNDLLAAPVPPSPSTATTSPGSETGTPTEEYFSLPDLSEVVIDADERDRIGRGPRREINEKRGQVAEAKEGIHSADYQEFLDKYCFFRSYSSTTTPSPSASRTITPPSTSSTTSIPTPTVPINPYGHSYPTLAPREQVTPTHPQQAIGGHGHGLATLDNYFSFQPHAGGHGNVTDHASAGHTPFLPFGGSATSYPNSYGTLYTHGTTAHGHAVGPIGSMAFGGSVARTPDGNVGDWTGERRSSSRSRTASESRSSSPSPANSGMAGASTPAAVAGIGTMEMAVH